jgi:hypothetical protein
MPLFLLHDGIFAPPILLSPNFSLGSVSRLRKYFVNDIMIELDNKKNLTQIE